MKRSLTIAVASALLATLLGGVASASESNDFVAAADTVALDRDRPDLDPQQILRRCRYLFGENELADVTQERCRELWNRWCQAYPRTPQCRPDRPTDRPIDRPADRPADRPTVRRVEPPSTGGPVVGPPDKADLDRVRDRDSHDVDREGNDTHVRARRADL
jgi:hypothetical protein